MVAGADPTTNSPGLAMFDSAPRDPALVSDLLTWCSQLLEADAAVVCWSDDDGLHVLSVAEQDGARAEERLLPPEHPLAIVLTDTQRGSGEVGEIAEPMSRGMIEDLGRYIAVPLALPASADGGALIALTGEREAGEDAAETLTMVARVISRELAGIQRHRDTDNLRSMVDLASNSFLVLDVTGRITFANEANRGILGYGPEELAGNRAFAFVHPDDLSRVTTHFDSVVQTHGVSNPIEWRLRHQNGTWRHLTVTATNLLDDATFQGILVDAIDITGHRASEDALRFRAMHDSLTALPNRELFIERASQAFSRADHNHSIVAIIFIDLDRFKQVNDLMGHAMGDAVLRTFAGRLATTLRPYDTVARFGGTSSSVFWKILRTRTISRSSPNDCSMC